MLFYLLFVFFFFFKQKTAYEMRISDWSSDVCSSDLWFGGKADGDYTFQKLLFLDIGAGFGVKSLFQDPAMREAYSKYADIDMEIGRASCRERVCQYV